MSERPVIEVRMPTYKRPDFLRRALGSLIAQTYTEWICHVLDDSPGHEAEGVINDFADSRIVYRPNEKNLGILLNIDKSFHPKPFGDADIGCVLEDDNYFRPTYFERNIELFGTHDTSIILSNAQVESALGLTSRSLYGESYVEGKLDLTRLYGTFFYSSGLSNSCVMWKFSDHIDLQTSKHSDNPVTGERLRTLRIARDVYIAMDPLVVWWDNGEDTYRPKATSRLAWRMGQIEYGTYERAIYSALHQWLKSRNVEELAFNPVVDTIDGARLRPIVRAGIPIPARYQRLAAIDLLKLKAKVAAMLVAGRLLGISPKYTFVGDRIERVS